MKRLLFAALLLLVTGCTVERVAAYDFEQAWRYLYTAATAENRLLRAENRTLKPLAEAAPVLIERNEELETELLHVKEELADANQIVALAGSVSDLEYQVASLNSSAGSVQAALFRAQSELGRVLAATKNIETAVGTFTSWRFTSGSMEPAFGKRDLVFLQWFPPSVRVGDIVGSYNPDCLFTHRIVAKVEGGYRIKGDNKPNPDNCTVTFEQIRYRVAAIAKNIYW